MWVCHFTSTDKWLEIQKDGFLRARSDPFRVLHSAELREKISKEIRKICKARGYVVGVPHDKLNAWQSHGLLYYVLKHRPNIQLMFEIALPAASGFFREHTEYSPKAFANAGLISDLDEFADVFYYPRTDAFKLRYVESSMPLDRYKSSTVRVPELWLAQDIPLSQIRSQVIRSDRAIARL